MVLVNRLAWMNTWLLKGFLQAIHPNLIREIFTYINVICAGIGVGVLVNYLTEVLPQSRNIARPSCTKCGQPTSIKAILLPEPCPHCGVQRLTRYSLILILSVLSSVLLKSFPFASLGFWGTLPVLIFLEVILVIDIEHHRVLIETSLFGVLLFLIYGILLRGLLHTLLGGLGGLLTMLAFYLLGVIFSKLIGKLRGREISEVAFGFGDVCAGTFLGLLAGWPGITAAIIIAILIFTAYAIILLLGLWITNKYRAFANAQPFVPFLVLGAIIVFYL